MKILTRWALSLSAVAAVGIVAVLVLTVISGINYRLAEEAGGEIPPTGEWIVTGTYVGLAVAALALAGLIAVGVIALMQRASRKPAAARSRA